jgi:hypothetical protein
MVSALREGEHGVGLLGDRRQEDPEQQSCR